MKKEKKVNRVVRFDLRLTPEEKEIVRRKAAENNYLSIADYVRDRILNDTQLVIDSTEFVKSVSLMGAEVNRVGNNINQTVRAINANQKVGIPLDNAVLIHLDNLYTEYLKCMKVVETQFKGIMRIFKATKGK